MRFRVLRPSFPSRKALTAEPLMSDTVPADRWATPTKGVPVDLSETIEQIQQYGKMADVRLVSTFKGHRESRDGRMLEVTVQIQDAGPRASRGTRYCITATDEE